MLENHLIANKQNPELEPVQMLAQLQYVFTPKNVSARTRIPEIAHHHYPGNSTLPDTMLLGRRIANALEVN